MDGWMKENQLISQPFITIIVVIIIIIYNNYLPRERNEP